MSGRGGEIDRSTGTQQRGAYAAFDDTVRSAVPVKCPYRSVTTAARTD